MQSEILFWGKIVQEVYITVKEIVLLFNEFREVMLQQIQSVLMFHQFVW